jgi:pilus assembly protein CpaB
MSARTSVVALASAAVAAALGTGLLWLYLEHHEQQVAGGPRVPVLMALEPLARGQVLSEEQLAVREVPQAYVEDRFVKAFDRAKVLGLRLGNEVQAQQTLFWTDLALAGDEPRELSTLVPSGSRAVSVRASSGDPDVALVRPGDYVDVIANLPRGEGVTRAAVVLLQKTLVLAVGHQTAREPASDAAGWAAGAQSTVTLSVSLRQAQLLSLATERGTLKLALRNPDDPRISDHVADVSADALSDPARSPAAPGERSGPVRLEVAPP